MEQLFNGQIQILLIFSGISIFLIIVGFIQLKFPPKEINALYGYRSPQAMSSEKKWHFAQPYSAKWMIQIGSVLLASHLPFFFFAMSPLVLTISYILEMIILMVLMIIFTEKKLKEVK